MEGRPNCSLRGGCKSNCHLECEGMTGLSPTEAAATAQTQGDKFYQRIRDHYDKYAGWNEYERALKEQGLSS